MGLYRSVHTCVEINFHGRLRMDDTLRPPFWLSVEDFPLTPPDWVTTSEPLIKKGGQEVKLSKPAGQQPLYSSTAALQFGNEPRSLFLAFNISKNSDFFILYWRQTNISYYVKWAQMLWRPPTSWEVKLYKELDVKLPHLYFYWAVNLLCFMLLLHCVIILLFVRTWVFSFYAILYFCFTTEIEKYSNFNREILCFLIQYIYLCKW